MRAHHNACSEAGAGRCGPGSSEATASGALVEAGVDGEFTELFAFGVGAVHEQFAGAGGGGVDFIVEVYATVPGFHCDGADARRIQNRMTALGMHVLLHSLHLSVLPKTTLPYVDPLSAHRQNLPVSTESHWLLTISISCRR